MVSYARSVSDLREHFDDLDDCPVEILFWPADASRRDALARVGVPRVLLVDPHVAPPTLRGVDEDWVRLPANNDDVLARAAQLTRFAQNLRGDEPHIDDHRILHRAGMSIPLSTTEAAILSLLLKRRGAVVPIADLEREVWHGNTLSRDAVDAAIYRLRRRLSGLNLVVRAVRNRGFIIDLD